MNRTISVAAAVAAVLGSAGAQAAAPSLASIASSTNSVYLAGSSAAKNGVTNAILANICGGAANAYQFTSTGNGNFLAISCVPVAAVNATNAGAVYNFYYRTEGGSVTGMLPIANNDTENQLALTTANFTTNGCTDATPTCGIAVTGTSATNGVDDSFGPAGALALHAVDIGISDVEPAALIGNNYPTPYSTTVWGPVNPGGLAALTATPLFGEVYALFVNQSSGFNSTTTPLNLSQEMVRNILTHKIKNWSLVTDTSGASVGTGAITIVNREQGSGSRAATDLLIVGDTCSSGAGTIFNSGNQYFSTGDVLTAAGTVAGAITYATIDQSKANLVQVNLNGVTPSNLAAASGAYPFWVEATFVQNSASTADGVVMTFLEKALQTEATAPHLADILAIPGLGNGTGGNAAHSILANSASAGSTALGAATIYVNPFTRNTVTCALPQSVITAQ